MCIINSDLYLVYCFVVFSRRQESLERPLVVARGRVSKKTVSRRRPERRRVSDYTNFDRFPRNTAARRLASVSLRFARGARNTCPRGKRYLIIITRAGCGERSGCALRVDGAPDHTRSSFARVAAANRRFVFFVLRRERLSNILFFNVQQIIRLIVKSERLFF